MYPTIKSCYRNKPMFFCTMRIFWILLITKTVLSNPLVIGYECRMQKVKWNLSFFNSCEFDHYWPRISIKTVLSNPLVIVYESRMQKLKWNLSVFNSCEFDHYWPRISIKIVHIFILYARNKLWLDAVCRDPSHHIYVKVKASCSSAWETNGFMIACDDSHMQLIANGHVG